MKLLRARISSFKSILETTLSVDSKITVLVGPNEGGKTNVLRALECFSPDKQFSEGLVCQFSEAYQERQPPEVQLLFGEFSEDDRNVLIDAWRKATYPGRGGEQGKPQGADAGTRASDGASSIGDGGKGTQEIAPPEPPGLGAFTRLSVTKQGNDLDGYITHIGDYEVSFANDAVQRAFTRDLLQILPKFVYFEDINLLQGEIEVQKLLSNDPSLNTERDLLGLGGMTNLEILAGPPNRRDVAIKKAEQQVTDRLRKYWTQDATRQFHINVDRDVLRIHISDGTGVFDFPEDRSLGSRWFISFYINFASRIEHHKENALLLFDEPGIHVHPKGQRDLLPIFEEIGAKYQLIYSTHLPFLINRNFPSRIRVVEKKQKLGTTVNNKPHSSRWKAIRSAVGLLAADSFLLGDSCLVVEGVSDHLFIAGLSPFLAELGEPHLDLNETAIIPADGASETVSPARFCQAERIPVVVLLDSDNQGDQAAEALSKDGFIRPEQIVRVAEMRAGAGAHERHFEDLLPLERFVAAVNAACAPVIKQFAPLTTADVATAQNESHVVIPVVNAIKKIFAERKYGDFDKRLVAGRFVSDLPLVENLSKSESDSLKKDFAACAKLIEIIRGRLRKIASEMEK